MSFGVGEWGCCKFVYCLPDTHSVTLLTHKQTKGGKFKFISYPENHPTTVVYYIDMKHA